MPSIKDIANLLQISPGTVSKGMNNAPDISEELKNKILQTAIEIGYVSKKMKKNKKATLCVFLKNTATDVNNQFCHDVILGFKYFALATEYSVEVINTSLAFQTNTDYDLYMLKNGYVGSFFIGFSLTDPWIKTLHKTSIPTVLLDNFIPENQKVAYIGTDNTEAMTQVIRHFHTLGHKKIAFLNGDEASMISVSRNTAFEYALSLFELERFDNQIQYGHYNPTTSRLHVPTFIEEDVTAIICGSDIMAMALMSEYQNKGYHVPHDISIIGFDDLPLSAHLTPPLSSVRQDRDSLGRLAFSTLRTLTDGIPISRTLLRPTLVERASTHLNLKTR